MKQVDGMGHNCTIGVLNAYEDTRIVTIIGLQSINEQKARKNDYIESMPLKEKAKKRIRQKIWTIKEYADKRVNTDLTRFNYCPICGEKITWEEIGRTGGDNDV